MPPQEPKSAPIKRLTHSTVIQGDQNACYPFAAGGLSAALALLAVISTPSLAQKKYDTGATDTEIKIGNIMPYSGPASAYGVIGKTEEAYMRKVNAEGGINGRKINFISYDDNYSPPKTVEQARKLVESERGPAGLQSAGHGRRIRRSKST